MRRKDGQPKQRAPRNLPQFDHGFRESPALAGLRHPLWDGRRTAGNYSVVSLFAGCGGLDLGLTGGFEFLGRRFEPLPLDIAYAADNLPDAVDAYRLNLGDHIQDVDLTRVDVRDIPPAEVLAGGFPCQDFSSSGPKVGLSGDRGQLYRVLVDYMEAHRPSVVIGENVPHLARLRGGAYLRHILADLEGAGYHFRVWNLYAPDFGLPQSRRRLFLIGVRDDLPGFPLRPQPSHEHAHVSIDKAIFDLEDVTDESVPNQSQYFRASRATSGGGQGDHTNRRDEVAYCIRANSRGRIQFHYDLPRRLTVRECARLQSFPDEFVFPFTTQRNLTLIGNAVPPLLGHAVGRNVVEFLAGRATDSSDSGGLAVQGALDFNEVGETNPE